MFGVVFVVCCLLFVVRCLLFVVYCLLSVMRCLLSVDWCMCALCAARAVFDVWPWLLGVCCLLCGV